MGDWAEYEIEKEEGFCEDENDKSWEESKKDKRLSNTQWSTNYLVSQGIEFESKNKGSHLVLKDFDFWPATGLFICKQTKKQRRGVKHLVNMIKERNT